MVTPGFRGGAAAVDALGAGRASARIAEPKRDPADASLRGAADLRCDAVTAAGFPASDEAAHVSGHELVVDGGTTLDGRTRHDG